MCKIVTLVNSVTAARTGPYCHFKDAETTNRPIIPRFRHTASKFCKFKCDKMEDCVAAQFSTTTGICALKGEARLLRPKRGQDVYIKKGLNVPRKSKNSYCTYIAVWRKSIMAHVRVIRTETASMTSWWDDVIVYSHDQTDSLFTRPSTGYLHRQTKEYFEPVFFRNFSERKMWKSARLVSVT